MKTRRPRTLLPANESRRSFTRNLGLGAAALLAKPFRALATSPVPATPHFKTILNTGWTINELHATTPPESITLPNSAAHLSWREWNPSSWQKIWLYQRDLPWNESWRGQRVFLEFDGAQVTATPSINGIALASHAGGYLPFRRELTQHLRPGNNTLAVTVDARWQDVPPDGSPKGPISIDYLEPGGIHRNAYLMVVPPVFLADVYAKPLNVLSNNPSVQIICTLDAASAPTKPLQLHAELRDGTHVLATSSTSATGSAEATLTLTKLGPIALWSPDTPRLYTLVVSLRDAGRTVHTHTQRIGFREASFTPEGFFLNGKRFRLFGLNRHELFPYVGGAMPDRVHRHDAAILKHDFHCNMVRCSHYPQSPAFLDACDELGLMVWEETPGWQYLGDAAFTDQVVEQVEAMIRRDRSRPSIIIWGVRVNESINDVPLYQRTTAAAKALDDLRPCSGSMTTFKNWQTTWHEDVFARDDYHTGADGQVGIYPPLPGIPYMLAETVGQYSYGGKGFSNFYTRTAATTMQSDQAIFHAQAHDRAAAFPTMCGVIAWCAFEYASLLNTTDGIKHPGVADLFRIPKLGASFYLAQGDPAVRPIIAENFYWHFGPESPRGPGKHASIFSNCETLRVSIDGHTLATLHPDHANYPNTKHPPFFLDLDFATPPDVLKIEGLIAGRVVTTRSFSANSPAQLAVTADDLELLADGSDATRIAIRTVDRFGSPRGFASGELSFRIEGSGDLIGDEKLSLAANGGVGAVWIKTRPNSEGTILVHVHHNILGEQTIRIRARRA